MALLGGWLGPALTVLSQQQAAGQRGKFEGAQMLRQQQMEDEERERQRKMDALTMALTQERIADMQQPDAPAEYKPTTYEESVRYYRDTHPEKPEAPRNVDPLSPEGIKAALERKRRERQLEISMPMPEKPSTPKEWDEQGYRAKRIDELTTRKRAFNPYGGTWSESPAMSLDEANALVDQEVSRIRGGAQPSMPTGQTRVNKTIGDYLRTRKNAVGPTPATQATESVTPLEQSDPMAEQRAAWDEAAQVLQGQGKDPVSVLGPRP